VPALDRRSRDIQYKASNYETSVRLCVGPLVGLNFSFLLFSYKRRGNKWCERCCDNEIL